MVLKVTNPHFPALEILIRHFIFLHQTENLPLIHRHIADVDFNLQTDSLTVTLNPGADDAKIIPQWSSDLST